MFFEECQKDMKEILALVKPEASKDNLSALLLFVKLRKRVAEYLGGNPNMVDDIRMKALLVQIQQSYEFYIDSMKCIRIKEFDYFETFSRK